MEVVERNMSNAVMRGIAVLPGSKSTSRAKGMHRKLGDPVTITHDEVTVRFHRRAHLPIVLASGLFDKPVAVPWWDGQPLRLVE